MAEIVGWAAASLAFYCVLLWIYHLSMALVGHALGAKVELVSIGFDIGGWRIRWPGRWWQWQIGILPTGGYTKFVGEGPAPQVPGKKDVDATLIEDRLGRKLPRGSILLVPPLARICIVLLGPLSAALFAIVVLMLPARLGAPQLELCGAAETEIRPLAVSGLRSADVPATERGQLALAGEISWQTLRRIFFLAPRDGWGGPFAYLVMSVQAGRHSLAAWLTCMGVFGLFISLVNLLPMPSLFGWQVLTYCAEMLGFLMSEKWQIRLTLMGLLPVMLAFLRLIWFDAMWIWTHVFTG